MPRKLKSEPKFWQDVGVSFSSANLMFFKQWSDLTLSSGASAHTDWTYEIISVTNSSYLAILACVLFVGTFFLSMISYFRRKNRPNGVFVVHVLMFLSLFSAFNSLRVANGWGVAFGRVGLWRFAIFGAVAAFLVWGILKSRYRFVLAFRTFSLLLGPFIFVTSFHALRGIVTYTRSQKELYENAQVRVVQSQKYLPSTEKKTTPKRVIVNLFDEWDYSRITDSNQQKKLPELASWIKQSVVATQARPPGPSTAYSMPSFFIGEKVVEPLHLEQGRLTYSVRTPDGIKQEKKWREQDNLIHSLKARGFKVAIIGWYLPYCRMFAYSADYYARYPHYNFQKSRYQENLLPSVKGLLSEVTNLRPKRQYFHLETLKGVQREAERLVADANFDFVFIHWPVPHAPWIFDSKLGEFSDQNQKGPEGYFDNLQAVDLLMHRQREKMQNSGVWDKTNIISLSDHGWNSSQELDGHWDVRTPFIVKLTKGSENKSFDKPFNTVVLKDLIQELMLANIESTDDLTAWLDSHRSESSENNPTL